MLHIYVDADACPVKQEIYKVAQRYELNVTLVANAWMRIPHYDWLVLEVVKDFFDAADDWIVDRAQPHDIVVTTDIPLAARCLEKGARVIGPRGREFDEDSIGDALAKRELLSHLRDIGEIGGGPAPFEKRDRSTFLQHLDRIIQAILRKREKGKL